MTDDWTDRDILDYLAALDESSHEVTDFDADFIATNLDRKHPFTQPQRQHIARMVARYGEDL